METELDAVATTGQKTLQRIEALIYELNALDAVWKQRLRAVTRLERRDLPDFIPGWHDFIVSIKGIAKSVQRLLKDRSALKVEEGFDSDGFAREEQDSKDMAKIRSCGLQPHQAQWDCIKRTHGLLALQRRFSWRTGAVGPTIDAVVENGSEWLKVLTLTEKKFHMQLAEEGWHPDDSSEDEADDSDDDDSGIPIINITKQLVKAARSNRCNTRIPRIRLVLPNIALGQGTQAITRLFSRVRSLGISKKQEGDVEILVDCADSAFLQSAIPPLETVWANFFRNTNQDRLTSTLNLELTFILSLVSDIAHAEVKPQAWYSRQTLSHIEDELHAPGVRLQSAYSCLRGRSLECTQSVAREVRNVVDDLGTETTKARAMVFFGRRAMKDVDIPRNQSGSQVRGTGNSSAEKIVASITSAETERERLISELRKLSKYPVPDDLQLPIQVVGEDEFDPEDFQALIDAGKLPAVAAHVSAELDRAYSRSCHLWGWLQDNTTVSANCLTVRMIEATVDKNRPNALETGPRLHITSLAISINTARPCPHDKWEEIRESKHQRKEARTKEAKYLKANGAWGPSLGVPVTWDQKKVKEQARKKDGQLPPLGS
ncbi:unnamed protein product [Discula destructiva]